MTGRSPGGLAPTTAASAPDGTVATLAIATSTGQVGVAVTGAGPTGVAGTVAASITVRAGRRHGETLAPAIDALLRITGLELSAVGRVAVDVGPGLFTGLRVGVATAKALAAALAVPVVPVPSLDILAHPHRGARRPVASVVDARRGEVFWALYEPVEGRMVSVNEPAVLPPAALAEELRRLPGNLLLTGDGARRYFAAGPPEAGDGDRFPGFDVAPEEFDHPSATVLLDLAGGRADVAAEKVTPNYLRGADVRIGWEQR